MNEDKVITENRYLVHGEPIEVSRKWANLVLFPWFNAVGWKVGGGVTGEDHDKFTVTCVWDSESATVDPAMFLQIVYALEKGLKPDLTAYASKPEKPLKTMYTADLKPIVIDLAWQESTLSPWLDAIGWTISGTTDMAATPPSYTVTMVTDYAGSLVAPKTTALIVAALKEGMEYPITPQYACRPNEEAEEKSDEDLNDIEFMQKYGHLRGCQTLYMYQDRPISVPLSVVDGVLRPWAESVGWKYYMTFHGKGEHAPCILTRATDYADNEVTAEHMGRIIGILRGGVSVSWEDLLSVVADHLGYAVKSHEEEDDPEQTGRLELEHTMSDAFKSPMQEHEEAMREALKGMEAQDGDTGLYEAMRGILKTAGAEALLRGVTVRKVRDVMRGVARGLDWILDDEEDPEAPHARARDTRAREELSYPATLLCPECGKMASFTVPGSDPPVPIPPTSSDAGVYRCLYPGCPVHSFSENGWIDYDHGSRERSEAPMSKSAFCPRCGKESSFTVPYGVPGGKPLHRCLSEDCPVYTFYQDGEINYERATGWSRGLCPGCYAAPDIADLREVRLAIQAGQLPQALRCPDPDCHIDTFTYDGVMVSSKQAESAIPKSAIAPCPECGSKLVKMVGKGDLSRIVRYLCLNEHCSVGTIAADKIETRKEI